MTSYASDSSEGEFTETDVLLGYVSRDVENETVSKLGGKPDWFDADKPASAALARCKACQNVMALILQLNAELPEKFPSHDRRLYVFACRRQTCRRKSGSIRAVRGVRSWGEGDASKSSPREELLKEQRKQQDAGSGSLGDALFGTRSSANPFASNANPFASSNGTKGSVESSVDKEQESATGLSKTFAETLSLNAPSTKAPEAPSWEPWPSPSAQPDPYPTLYLAEADYETLEPTSTEMPDSARIESADAAETVSALDREAFESSMDATFQKFADRMAQNPEQVIRYEFGGTPLLYCKTDMVGMKLAQYDNGSAMPGCANCGGRRTFEVQLTPNAIAELEADDMSLDGMEWGTIIVGVCESDCLPRWIEKNEAGYLEEWAGVQWEELSTQKK